MAASKAEGAMVLDPTSSAADADAAARVRLLEKEIADLDGKIRLLPKTLKEAVRFASEHELNPRPRPSGGGGDDRDSANANATPEAGASRLMSFRFALQRERWEKKLEAARIVEEGRVARAVAEAEESQPGMTRLPDLVEDKECPICLETVRQPEFYGDVVASHLVCCGNYVCVECCRDSTAQRIGFDSCPLCRRALARDDRVSYGYVLAHAEAGKKWAQREIGRKFIKGTGCKKNARKAACWYRRAAEQGDGYAQCALGQLYMNGMGGLPKSQVEARRYLDLAAKQGSPEAQYCLGAMIAGEGDLDCNGPGLLVEEALRWFTLSASQGHGAAQFNVGVFHFKGGAGLPPSPETAMLYFEKAALKGNGRGQMMLARMLMDTAAELYDGRYNLVGYSAVPRAVYWARKATKADRANKDEALKITGGLKTFEQSMGKECGNCGKPPQKGTSLRKCVRCVAIAYCGKECQVAHWKAGHKIDCVDCKKLDAVVESNQL